MFDNHYMQLLISLKVNQLKREELSSLTYEHVESALISICKRQKVESFNQLADIVVNLSADDLIARTFTKANIDSVKMKIDDFSDLFGGDKKWRNHV